MKRITDKTLGAIAALHSIFGAAKTSELFGEDESERSTANQKSVEFNEAEDRLAERMRPARITRAVPSLCLAMAAEQLKHATPR
jgi:hypothetical protein